MSKSLITSSKAFTLIELMISIALVLVLMVGINQVFKTTSETVGAGQANATIIRNARAAETTFYYDLGGYTSDAPFLLITSERVSAFRDAKDQASDLDGSVLSQDLNGNNLENDTGENTRIPIYNNRNHRVDRLSFFARNLYRRQTANTGSFVSSTTSREAWIRYQMVHLPNNDAVPTFYGPADTPTASNHNNQYASQFTLGRIAMLLLDVPPSGEQAFQPPSAAALSAANGSFYPGSPLDVASTAQDGTLIQTNRYDLAATSIDAYTKILTNRINGGPIGAYSYTKKYTWWEQGSLDYKMDAYPFPPKPMDSAGFARSHPIFTQACSQFMVEYAGDFVAQDATGAVTDVAAYAYQRSAAPNDMINTIRATGTDGQIDFIITGSGVNQTRKIRWYGLPRDVDGDAVVTGADPTSGTANNLMPDVVPLRDVIWQWVKANAGTAPAGYVFAGAPFERNLNGLDFSSVDIPMPSNGSDDYAAGSGGLGAPGRYTCAWGPDTAGVPRPKMIRITMTLEDPNGRLDNGQTFEYVFNLP